jgi:hypothetical protein
VAATRRRTHRPRDGVGDPGRARHLGRRRRRGTAFLRSTSEQRRPRTMSGGAGDQRRRCANHCTLAAPSPHAVPWPTLHRRHCATIETPPMTAGPRQNLQHWERHQIEYLPGTRGAGVPGRPRRLSAVPAPATLLPRVLRHRRDHQLGDLPCQASPANACGYEDTINGSTGRSPAARPAPPGRPAPASPPTRTAAINPRRRGRRHGPVPLALHQRPRCGVRRLLPRRHRGEHRPPAERLRPGSVRRAAEWDRLHRRRRLQQQVRRGIVAGFR